MSSSLADLASGWLAAVGREEVVDAMSAIHLAAADAIEARGPACWASGRCCNFRDAGHLLYVTGLEAAYTVSRLPAERAMTRDALDAAVSRGDCPFLSANLCGVHAIKPVGCRVYFCDKSAQDWQHELSERLIRMVRGVHDRFGVEYRYGEWRVMLGAFLSA